MLTEESLMQSTAELGNADHNDAPASQTHEANPTLEVEEMLVEEISIDGMCGVY